MHMANRDIELLVCDRHGVNNLFCVWSDSGWSLGEGAFLF